MRIGAGKIDGKENAVGAFFTNPVDLDWRSDHHRHQTLRNLDTARDLSLHDIDLRSEIFLSEQEQREGDTVVRKEMAGRKYAIAFHPGAGKMPNRWPADRFAATANELAAIFHARIIITKGPMDDAPVAEMIRGLHEEPAIVENRPIREVAAILAQVRLVISNDTGIMHVAAAVGVPVLSLFGPTDPLQWAPMAEMHRFICAGPDIRSISIEEVIWNAKEMLKSKKME